MMTNEKSVLKVPSVTADHTVWNVMFLSYFISNGVYILYKVSV